MCSLTGQTSPDDAPVARGRPMDCFLADDLGEKYRMVSMLSWTNADIQAARWFVPVSGLCARLVVAKWTFN